MIRDGLALKVIGQGAEDFTALVSYAPMPYRCYRADARETMAAEGLQDVSVKEAGKIVAERIGIDRVLYNSIEDVIEACGGGDFCAACATGDYNFVKKELLRFPP